MESLRKKNVYVIGVFALLGSALLTASSQVFYANRVQSIHPFLFTGISFFITTCYFQVFAVRQSQNSKWKEALKPLIQLNLASVLTFMGFYYALKFIEPAIVSSLEMGLGPLFVLLISVMQSRAVRPTQWMLALSTFAACILLVLSIFFGKSAVPISLSWEVILGIGASVGCGLGAVLCTLYSKQLSEFGWTSSMILAKRFYGIILISFFFTYDVLVEYTLQNWEWILLITVAGVLIPMYLLQKGIQYCTPFIVMMSLCFIPVFTFIFQLFDPRLEWSIYTLVGVGLLFILGMSSVYIEKRAPS